LKKDYGSLSVCGFYLFDGKSYWLKKYNQDNVRVFVVRNHNTIISEKTDKIKNRKTWKHV